MKPVHSEPINSRVGDCETLQYSTSAVNTATNVVNECNLSLVLQTFMLFRKICLAVLNISEEPQKLWLANVNYRE